MGINDVRSDFRGFRVVVSDRDNVVLICKINGLIYICDNLRFCTFVIVSFCFPGWIGAGLEKIFLHWDFGI